VVREETGRAFIQQREWISSAEISGISNSTAGEPAPGSARVKYRVPIEGRLFFGWVTEAATVVKVKGRGPATRLVVGDPWGWAVRVHVYEGSRDVCFEGVRQGTVCGMAAVKHVSCRALGAVAGPARYPATFYHSAQIALDSIELAHKGLLGSVLGNIAQALLRLRHYELALAYAVAAMRVQPRPTLKVLYRGALAAAHLGQPSVSLYLLHRVRKHSLGVRDRSVCCICSASICSA
jgi:hypothetical protein